MLNTVTIAPTDKTYIEHDAHTSNFNGQMQLAWYDPNFFGTKRKRILLTHSLSALPPNAIVTSAVLNFTRTQVLNVLGNSLIFGVYSVSRSWVAAGVTWDTYDGSNAWTTVGGDYTTEFGTFEPVGTYTGDTTPAYYTADLGVDGVTHFNAVIQGAADYGLEVLLKTVPTRGDYILDLLMADGSLTIQYYTHNDSIVDVSN